MKCCNVSANGAVDSISQIALSLMLFQLFFFLRPQSKVTFCCCSRYFSFSKWRHYMITILLLVSTISSCGIDTGNNGSSISVIIIFIIIITTIITIITVR